MFCDLVGSTQMSSQLDPEDLRVLMASYYEAATQALVRFDGHVAQYLGDGLLVYFGYPEAHEDDPQRAVLAGFAILDAVAALNPRTPDERRPQLAARIGIDTGSVVVGESLDKGADVFGQVANIAARVQAVAEPGTIMITNAIHRLISGMFVVEDRGPQSLKGVASPVRLFRVVQPSGVRKGLNTADERGLTPFIGREDELGFLLSRWKLVCDGEGQMVLLLGEAGIGKSRLLVRFRDEIADAAHTWVDCGAAALHQNTPFYAVVDMLQQGFRWRGEQSTDERLNGLEASLESARVKPAEAIPLIAPLLNLPIPPKYPPLTITPERLRKRLLATIVAWALGTARIQPLVIAIEDLHWADPSTLEVIQLLAEQGANAPLLLVCTARPEFRAPWPHRAHHAQLMLNRLNARNVRELVARLTAHAPLATATVEALAERSGGVPLFVEELTRSVLESGAAEPALREIPATLQDSLMARLDRLGKAREVAQVASVIGQEFSWPLLSAVTSLQDQKLDEALRTLADAELLSVQGIAPEASYRFRHALIQDTAYQSLLRSKREQYHRQIAQTLAERFPEIAQAQPHLLAYHYTEANLTKEAIPQWQLAGQQAVQRSANFEAVSHFSKALELLKSVPDSPERFQQELALQLAVGTPLIVTKGFGSYEVGEVYARARDLCRQAGEIPQLFPVMWGLWMFYMARAEHMIARDLAEQCLRLAQKTGDTGFLVQAHHVRGVGLLGAGDFRQALEHLNETLATYDPAQHGSHAYIYGHDPAAVSLIHASWSLWFLGYPDQALKKHAEGLALAQKLSHPYTSATADAFASWLHQFCRNGQTAEELSSAAVTISTEHDFAFYRAMGMIMRGWALTQRAQQSEGIAEMRAGLNAYQVTGAVVLRPAYLSLLAEAYGNAGRAEEGLAVLDEAQKLADKCQEHWWQAELYRLKGELILKRAAEQSGVTNESDAEQCFRQALTVAKAQKAKSLELRAAMSLSLLRLSQSKRAEARHVLEECLGFFTEGFDTSDLVKAKELIGQLQDQYS